MHATEFSAADCEGPLAGRGRGADEGTAQPSWVMGAPPSQPAQNPVPLGVDAADLAEYSLMLGDDALLLAHRLSDWGVRAPGLAESSALLSICLDLLEQARALLSRAAELTATGADRLAYRRDSGEFRNVRLAEIDCGPGPGGDFTATVARLLLFATWRRALFDRLTGTSDPVLAAVARRHRAKLRAAQEHAARWVVELGTGELSRRRRVLAALHRVWPLAGELFSPHPVELRLAAAGAAVDPESVRGEVAGAVARVLAAADLQLPDLAQLRAAGRCGRYGVHTESMPFVLAELQHLFRADPVELEPPTP